MTNKFKKPGSKPITVSPEQSLKRYLYLTYIGQFEKTQFPLPLVYATDIETDRLKKTISRMAHQLKLLRSG